MPETQESAPRRKKKAAKPVEPPAKVTRYQVELSRRARETGLSLDELASQDSAAKLAKEKPEMEGMWFRIGKSSLNGVAYCTLDKLTCVAGRLSVERLHGPDVREVCAQRLMEEFAA